MDLMPLTSSQQPNKKKNKHLYIKDGFFLDLSYICPNIIAMSYPSTHKGSSKLYYNRNKIEDVQRFLELKHKGHYLVINLCIERFIEKSYSPEIFDNRVLFHGFVDQSPPEFQLIEKICAQMKKWLDKDEKNVVVIHCLAGVGRTGTIIACFLLYNGLVSTAQEALKLFATKRGIPVDRIIPSQQRWVGYFESYLKNDRKYLPVPILIHSIQIGTAFRFTRGRGFVVTVTQETSISTLSLSEIRRNSDGILLILETPKRVDRDFQMDFDRRQRGMTETKMTCSNLFHFWMNTAFLNPRPIPGEEQQQFTLSCNELEIIASEDGDSNPIPSDLMVTVFYTCPALQESSLESSKKDDGNSTISSSSSQDK